jgi:hypothetical protein
MYSCTLFLDLGTRRGWEVRVTPRPLSTPERDPVPIVQEAGWAPGQVWTGAENLASTGIRFPDRPARSQSLYRLSYSAHLFMCFVRIPVRISYIRANSDYSQYITYTESVYRAVRAECLNVIHVIAILWRVNFGHNDVWRFSISILFCAWFQKVCYRIYWSWIVPFAQ